MAVSENDFYELQGDSYRGSRYGNFAGGGMTPQGNVSSAATENQANSVGTARDISQDAPPTPTSPSQGLTGGDGAALETPRVSDMVIGAALPYAGNAIGQAAGAAIGAGSSFGEGLSQGVSSLINRASGGLLGAASTPTNIALSQMGGAYGPATQGAVNAASSASNVGSLGSGANIGGALGSGFATAAATLLTGGSVKDAVKSGAATAIGTAIGSAIMPVGGGFIGGFIGGLFCFVAGTPVLMADGTEKNVEDLELGDQVLEGGMVHGIAKALNDEMFLYKNTGVAGGHAVFEGGKWIRVQDSDHATPIDLGDKEFEVVYPIATENNLIITPWFISADILEVPASGDVTYSEADLLAMLNNSTDRNEVLAELEKEYCCRG